MNKPLKGKEDRGNLAVFLTCATFLFFTAIDTSAKWLISAGLSVPVIVFFRYSGHLFFNLLSSALQGEWGMWEWELSSNLVFQRRSCGGLIWVG